MLVFNWSYNRQRKFMAYCTFYIDLENVIKMREMNKEGVAMEHTKNPS